MEKILQQIEEEFAPQIQLAQETANSAQLELNNLQEVCAEKKKAVTDYYTALADIERAEAVIAKTDVSVKSEVSKLTITK